MESLRNKIAVVAVADTEVGMVPQYTATQLCIRAAKLAIEEAGITKDQVDGLITCNSFVEPVGYHAEMVAEYMQIFPRYTMTMPLGGAEVFRMIHHAASAILTGVCNTVLITMGDTMLSGLSRDGTIQAFYHNNSAFEIPYGPTVPAKYAFIAHAHMKQYGTRPEQLAAVAVAMRKHASMNPAAQMRKPITIDDVLSSKMIAAPLHLLDCSLISDGGGALIVTAAERARDFKQKPVYILGVGEGSSHKQISEAPSLTTSIGVRDSGKRAYEMAGLGPKDIDVAEVYDCFTPTVIVELEDLGFCAKGEGGPFVEGGRIELGGQLPLNTHGGLLSHCHPGNPGSIFHFTEAVRQLRGQCGSRQVKDAKVALAHAQGGTMSNHCTILLGSQPV